MMDRQKQHVSHFLRQGAYNGQSVVRAGGAFTAQYADAASLPEPSFRFGMASLPSNLPPTAAIAYAKRLTAALPGLQSP